MTLSNPIPQKEKYLPPIARRRAGCLLEGSRALVVYFPASWGSMLLSGGTLELRMLQYF